MNFIESYKRTFKEDVVKAELDKILSIAKKNNTEEIYKKVFECLDYTTLNSADTEKTVSSFVEGANKINGKYDLHVGGICVFPNFVSVVRDTMKSTKTKIAAVAASFPSSQTFHEIKISEVKLALLDGADEIDIVIHLGNFLEKEYDKVFFEISEIKSLMKNKVLKVILETGVIKDLNLIYKASILSMESGADFIKTSTGKAGDGASREAVFVMATAIKDFYTKTKKKVSLKPSGGIATAEDAVDYYTIMEQILGEDWLNNKSFRIGASRLADDLLNKISNK